MEKLLIKLCKNCSHHLNRIMSHVPWVRDLYDAAKGRIFLPIALRLMDLRYGLKTEGRVDLEELGIDSKDRTYYVPSGWFTMMHIIRVVPITEHDVFVDFGSGMGRMVFLAS